MINFHNLSVYRGDQQLIKSADLTINDGWHVGFVGHNGTGKSSLFALLLGELLPDAGEATIAKNWRVAHMAQEVDALAQSAIDYVLDGDVALRQVERNIAAADHHTDPMQLAHWHEAFDSMHGYSAKARAQTLLSGLGFQQAQLTNPVQSFSGGWRIRLNLARTLYQPSELLLLDEPTNHLDLEAVLWLQDFLKGYQGTLLLISHDRDFLDAVSTHTLHIYQQTLTLYTGNYSAFERQRAERMALAQSMFAKQQAQRAHLEDFVRRFRAKATKAKQAQSRLKALERMPLVQLAHADSPFSFSLPSSDKMSSPLMTLKFADLGHGDKTILHKVNFSLLPGMRIGLLGPNGAGKSTLIKTLTGTLRQLSGKRLLGDHLTIGYFSQHQTEALDASASPLLHLQRLSPDTKEQTHRDFLGGFGFAGDAALATVGNFSGGEKARLALALLAWQRPNLLLLDEPTNHLDLDMREALVIALQDFAGAMVLVSHDRHLLSSCVDEFWLVADGQVQPYDGDLEDYAGWLKQRQIQQKAVETTKTSATDSVEQKVDKKQDRKEAAEQRERLRPIKQKLQKLEKEMDQLATALAGLEAQLADASIYEADQKELLQQVLQQQVQVKNRLADVEEDWLTTTDMLAQGEVR
ncbi:MAG: ATP-binding cassette domain-containing protein [Thiotrichales bacterium]|jgi:ATP-binding cassette subfamily F protein 3|nr:ATP-binding cassette domain-containing protein [Thiotrichales bacterium]